MSKPVDNPRKWSAWMVVDSNGKWVAVTRSRAWARREHAGFDDEVIRVTIIEDKGGKG
jgi:hypothetical protein